MLQTEHQTGQEGSLFVFDESKSPDSGDQMLIWMIPQAASQWDLYTE